MTLSPSDVKVLREALVQSRGCLRTDQYDGHRRVENKIDAALALLDAQEAAQPSGAMKSAEVWAKEIVLQWDEKEDAAERLMEFIKRIQQDAIASQQPAPSGDARELVDQIFKLDAEYQGSLTQFACRDLMLEHCAFLITSYAARIRAEAVADALQVLPCLRDEGISGGNDWHYNRGIQDCDDAIRQLGKMGT